MIPSRKYVFFIEKIFPYRFKMAKLTKFPPMRWIVKKMLFEKNNLTVLPKDKVISIHLNKKIRQPENIIIPSKIVEYFINNSDYHFIMNFCLCRESMQCDNHSIELGCLFMGDAAKTINPELGRLVSNKEALEHVNKCRENGLIHVIGRDKIDETWLGINSKLSLLTVCSCCHCCCLWKILPHLDNKLSATVKKMPGLKIKINDNCTGCGLCTQNICFIDAIKIENDHASISNECRGCSRCIEICPNNAIEMTIEDSDFINKTIQRIKSAYNYNF
jgi:ferredoxin